MSEGAVRNFGILVVILLVGAALFFFWWSDGSLGPEEDGDTAQKNTETAVADTETAVTDTAVKPAESPTDKTLQADAAGETADNKSEAEDQVASLPVQVQSQPVIVEKKLTPPPADSTIAPMAAPRFDVVRVDENCGLLVAGQAEPTAKVRIYASGKRIGSAQASSRGEWVFVSDTPLTPGAKEINVKATNPNGQIVETARLVVMQVPDCSVVEEKRAPAIALLAPKNEDKGKFEERVSKLLQMPEPQGDLKAAKNLSLGSIDYDDKGNVALSGKGTPGNDVQVYVDNAPVGSATVDTKGNWSLAPETEIPAGTYNLRTDQLNKQGKVISRVEIPFQRTAADDVILAKGGLEIRAIVQPGNSLWRIARRMYGVGTQYTMIYQANQGQIKDPDLIFPGQIFKLPSEKLPQ